MSNNIRVRFAPSPTGYLHIGGMRTFLLNWLYARKTSGKIILRIEDTDQSRSTDENRNIIVQSIRQAGFDWDEGYLAGGDCGPYIQSERLDVYKHYSEQLIAEHKAYRCYCSAEDIETARVAWTKANPKIGFKYPGICRDRKDQPNDKPFVVRFIAPTEGYTEFTDKVFGHIRTPNIENQDFVIMRSDGFPLYNFGAVCDDHLMQISLVGRGADHLHNTIPQILLYQAFGWQHPEFAHLALMRSPNNEKLSKRHGSVSVLEFLDDKGYSPGAVMSYLSRFGFGIKNSDQELFSQEELIEAFSWDRCIKQDGKFDWIKFAAINFSYLKSAQYTSDLQYSIELRPFLQSKHNLDPSIYTLQSLIPLVRTRAKTLIEAADILSPILSNTITIDPEAEKQHLTPDNKTKLHDLVKALSTIELWSEQTLREKTTEWLTKSGFALKDIGPITRTALVGRTTSPELFQTMNAIGKQKTLERLAR